MPLAIDSENWYGRNRKSALAVTLTFDPETTKSKSPPNESGAVYSQVTMTSFVVALGESV